MDRNEKANELIEKARNLGLRLEFDSACEEKRIRAAEVGADKPKEPELF